MSPRKKAQAAFASALMLLFLSGLATYFATTRLLESERWVVHTHEVRAAVGDIDSALSRAGRARSAYVLDGGDDFLNQFQAALADIPSSLHSLRELTRDNPRQQELCSRLEEVLNRRVTLLRKSIALPKQSPDYGNSQADLSREAVPLSSDITSIMQQMREEEERLLQSRKQNSRRLFVVTVVTLVVAFILAIELFAVNYRLLSAELSARELAEKTVRESEESLRRLTGRLLQLQDAERRKFSRELHDSLGQYLAGSKMNLELFVQQRKDICLSEAIQLLDQAMSETRTISHLLHPPLLDEAGFVSAAKWYLEGFAQRSGIEIKTNLPEDLGSLPKPVALGLFRVLQESLTNIHRHSGSNKAEVSVELVSLGLLPSRVILDVRDYGRGIAPEVLTGFRGGAACSGVGLAGMRERIRDLGGEFSIQSRAPGILISASIPISVNDEAERTAVSAVG